MKSLSSEMQIFIIVQLALFETPQQVVESVKEKFGVELRRNHVFWYDAEKNPQLGEKWRELFYLVREKYQREIESIPIAHRSYRLRELQKILDRMKNAKPQNTVEMRAILEHAAKDAGSYFEARSCRRA
jgi:hypothetical protein